MKITIPTEEDLEFERRALLDPDLQEGGYKLTKLGIKVPSEGILQVKRHGK